MSVNNLQGAVLDGETVSHEVRLQWRNALLEELDEMVAR